MGVGLAAPVAGGRHAHEPCVQPVLHVAPEDPLLDQHGAPRRGALVVDVERATAVRERPVVDDRDELGGDLLPHAAGERRGALAVEVALEPVPHGLVQEDARPARPEDDRHGARRGVHGAELQHGLARRLPGEAPPAIGLEEELEGHAAAATVGPHLAPAALLGDRGDVEPRERADVSDRPAGRCRDQHDHLLARERDDHLPDTRVRRPAGRVHLPKEVELPRELGDDRRLAERIEIVGLAARWHGDGRRGAGAVGDRARLARRLLEVLDRDVVGVGVAGARPGERADAGALAHVTGRLFNRSFLELQVLVDTVLEVDVGVVDPPDEARA